MRKRERSVQVELSPRANHRTRDCACGGGVRADKTDDRDATTVDRGNPGDGRRDKSHPDVRGNEHGAVSRAIIWWRHVTRQAGLIEHSTYELAPRDGTREAYPLSVQR